MPAKKRTGGRVTPKGTQPAGTHTHKSGDRAVPVRGGDKQAPLPGRSSFGPVAPTRSGHHRGNR